MQACIYLFVYRDAYTLSIISATKWRMKECESAGIKLAILQLAKWYLLSTYHDTPRSVTQHRREDFRGRDTTMNASTLVLRELTNNGKIVETKT